MAILLTGFEPFGVREINSSEAIVNALARDDGVRPDCLNTTVLPTVYQLAGDEIARQIREVRPTAVICLGMRGQSRQICFERIAKNWDSCSLPDTAGALRRGQIILEGAPAFYESTLPIDRWLKLLNEQKVEAAISCDAGNYVCNHVFFRACHEVSQSRRPIPVGFIHVPPVAESLDTTDVGLSLATMLRAIKRCLAEFLPAD